LNSSGIREDIKAGNITFGDLYKVLPFESRLTTMELTGRQIKEILEQSVSKRDNIMQISGVSMYVDPEKPEGQKLSNIKIKSTYLDMDKVYRVTVDNFIAGGGDGYKTFMEGKNIEYGTLLVDSLCTYMKNHSPLTDDHAKIEGRISFKEIN